MTVECTDDATPELALWSAVLTQATQDCGSSNNTIAASAWRWLLSPSTAPSSFCWICSLFDLHPASVRAALRARGRTTPQRKEVHGEHED